MKTIAAILALLAVVSVRGQDTANTSGQLLHFAYAGVEVQAYPTGMLFGLHLDHMMRKDSALLSHGPHLRFGYNMVRHRDLGVHDNERGGGSGFSLGYNLHFNFKKYNGLLLTTRNDLWFNKIEWMDNNGIESGITNIIVVQPTIRAAYTRRIKHLLIAPSLAFGYEINTHQRGEDVGEGPVLLLGIMISGISVMKTK